MGCGHRPQHHVDQIGYITVVVQGATVPATVEETGPVGGGPADEGDGDLLADPPQIVGDGRTPLPQQAPGGVPGRLGQQGTDLRGGAVDPLGQLRADLEIGPLPPTPLGELAHRTDDGFDGRPGVVARLGPGRLEEPVTALGDHRDVPAYKGRQHLVAPTQVIVDGRGVALVGGPHDLGQGHVVDAPFGKEARRGVEQLVAGGDGLGHGVPPYRGSGPPVPIQLHNKTQSGRVHDMPETKGEDRPSTALMVGSRQRIIFIVTALGAFMASLDLSIVNVAFPALEHSFPHDHRATLAWVITGYGIVFGSLLVTAGRTADRLGSRRVFFCGLGIFCGGSALCGLAPTVALLVAGRIIQGCGAAALLPASLGLLLGAFPKEKRSQAVALWGGVGALAVATGPSFGALLITGAGWRWVFFVNLPVGAVAWLVGRRVLTETKSDAHRAAPDYLGVALISLALAALVLGISEGPTWGWSSVRIVGAFVTAVVVGSAFLRRSSRHPEPVLDLTLFRSRSFSVANAATFSYSMGFFAMLLGNILFLTSVWHYSILEAGLAVTPGPLVVAAVSGPAGKLASRIGFRPVLLVGFVVFVSGLSWYALRVGIAPDYVSIWLPATLITGLGIGLTFPVLSAAAVSSLHPERFAVGSAVNQTARQVGGAVGVALLVVILGSPNSPAAALSDFHHLWWYAAGAAATAGLLCALLRPLHLAGAAAVPPAVTGRADVPVTTLASDGASSGPAVRGLSSPAAG